MSLLTYEIFKNGINFQKWVPIHKEP